MCITEASICVILAFLLCNFSENFGTFVLLFVFTHVGKVEEVFLPPFVGFFVDVVDGSSQFGDVFGCISKRSLFIDRDRKLLRVVYNMSNWKSPSESGFQLAPY